MQPKSKKGKNSPPVVDGLWTQVKDQEELNKESEEKRHFQLERDKIQAFWEISKKNLEETNAKIRNGQREREEVQERHQVKITLYKQKLKHVLSEHQNSASSMKLDHVASASLVQKQHTTSELGLQGELCGLRLDIRHKRLQDDERIKNLKLKHLVELMEQANGYDRMIREIEVKYFNMIKTVKEAANRKAKVEVEEMDKNMRSRATALMEEHTKALHVVADYYFVTRTKLLKDQRVLEENLEEMKARLSRVEKQLRSDELEDKRLSQRLQEAQQKEPVLLKQLEEYNDAVARAAKSRAQVKRLEKELRDLRVDRELLLQAFQKVQKERDDLLQTQRQAILDVAQRCTLKELRLRNKLTELTQTLEKEEARRSAVYADSD